jgi:hypothetical protein
VNKIVSLRGDIPPGEVNEDVISMLERYLERARSGEVTSVAIGIVHSNATRIGTEWSAAIGESFMLIAAVATLNARIGISMAEAGEG